MFPYLSQSTNPVWLQLNTWLRRRDAAALAPSAMAPIRGAQSGNADRTNSGG